jgi:hypothetical protein
MQRDVRKYAAYFKLVKTGEESYSDTWGKNVLRIANNKVQIRDEKGDWKVAKYGDLILSIIYNIPLHS